MPFDVVAQLKSIDQAVRRNIPGLGEVGMRIRFLIHVNQAVINIRRHHGDDLAALDAAIQSRWVGGHSQDQRAALTRVAFHRTRRCDSVRKTEQERDESSKQEGSPLSSVSLLR